MNTHLPTAEEALLLCRTAAGQIEFARNYTLELLQHTPQELWYQTPEGAPSCVAWQVGHLAVSQYGLLMFRQRGRQPEDLDLIPGRFRKAFGRGSTPPIVPTEAGEAQDAPASTAALPTSDELLQRLADVHTAAMAEIAAISDGQALLEEVDMPYAVYPIKLGAILFCPLHEHIHCGQIGLLRRMLGLPPIR
ncbi:DinB family protein [Roseimaritima ulvae]|uniref:DinB superfamily protein n=1 Tax=Roseimaritima ulvae TaxID=980254 RepID=A0A5B9QXV7_9BACT|nr:DinB family protein [Roseimaritima ulvae]QEG43857.1 DinB superfamily protein [Roseimaritima ulvae]